MAESEGWERKEMSRQTLAHSGDCTIFRSVVNNSPTDGICTCGYGWECVRNTGGDWSEMFSSERLSMERRKPKATRREAVFYREQLELITKDKRKTKARRIAESALLFWDEMMKVNRKPHRPKTL